MRVEGLRRIAPAVALTLAVAACTQESSADQTDRTPAPTPVPPVELVVEPTHTDYKFPPQIEMGVDCTKEDSGYDHSFGPAVKEMPVRIIANPEHPAVLVTNANTPDADITLAKTAAGVFPIEKPGNPGAVVVGIEVPTDFLIKSPTGGSVESYGLCVPGAAELPREITSRRQDFEKTRGIKPVTVFSAGPDGQLRRAA